MFNLNFISQKRSGARIGKDILPQTTPTITNKNIYFLKLVRDIRVVRSLLLFLILTFLFTGCEEPKDDSIGTLHGVWYYSSAIWKEYRSIDIIEKKVVYENNYEADIVNSPDFKAKNGILIIKFTKYFDWDEMDFSTVHESVEKFGALYWTDLKSNSVSMSDAWVGYDHKMFTTQTEAEAAFTLDKTGDYISVWGGPFYK